GIGRFYRDRGRYLEAERMFERSLAVLAAAGEDHPDLPVARNNLATLYRMEGKLSAAERLYRQGLAVLERRLGSDDPAVAGALSNLAEVLLESGENVQAERLLERAVNLLRATEGPGRERLPATMDQL